MIISTKFIAARIEFSVSTGEGQKPAHVTILPLPDGLRKCTFYLEDRVIGQQSLAYPLDTYNLVVRAWMWVYTEDMMRCTFNSKP